MEFFDYFAKIDNLVGIFEFVSFFVISVMLFRKTGKISYLESLLKNLLEKGDSDVAKYRLENYQEKNPVKGQVFDKLIKVYRLNKVTGKLEETEETIDIQEMVNSSLSTCMTEVLSKFFPENIPQDESIIQVGEMQDDLDFLQETFQIAEKYRDALNLGADVSVQEIFACVQKEKTALENSLKQEKKETVVGGVEDEKKEII